MFRWLRRYVLQLFWSTWSGMGVRWTLESPLDLSIALPARAYLARFFWYIKGHPRRM